MRVGVIIPAYNEAERIGATIQAVQSLPEVNEVLVVDDGSTDDTTSESLRAGARVVWHQRNYGKGQALRTGFQSIQSDIVVVVDADMGEGACEIRKLIQPVMEGVSDLTIAAFPPPEGKNGFGLVKGLAVWGIRRLTGFVASSPLSGQRAFRKEIISRLSLSDGYGAEVAMTIDVLRAGFRVSEVPVAMYNREYGRTLRGFLHRGRQFVHVLRALAERWEDSGEMPSAEEPTSSWR
ncbi:glycosyltransferase family 2 protein [Effusibacillus lacus]|uniref:Glycosyl transferase n=1 Tax=Effusibacillus lacus TaxID=1348429 RepID=A0A292YSJ5_9BACL|nr:glycosyltransferase family 2 protein [Effusibacillus lacus]TCS76357.1 glycosyltransferase involved in cell wall biosynthesis [Effusibacillus lacus]GAX91899.1 glycosyl transferase [Effusibacillus lacus]